VQTHGWILDADGKAMHKSVGKVVSPLEVIENNGSDIFRLWACSSDWRTDVRVGEEILTRVTDAYRKVRNTFRFLLANLSDYPIEGVAGTRRAEARSDPLNAAFLARLDTAFREVHSDYAASRNHSAVSRLVDLGTTDLSAIYMDVRKDALYTLPVDDPLRRSTQAVLAHALEQLVHAWAPVLSYTAEQVWSHSPWLSGRAESVFLSEWPSLPEATPSQQGKVLPWSVLLGVRDAVNQVLEPRRAAKEFASFAEVSVVLSADGEVKQLLDSLNPESWRSLLLVSEVVIGDLDGNGDSALQPLGPGLGRLGVTVTRTGHRRCERCWIHRVSVGQSAEQPGLCERCLNALPEGFVLTTE
jgi:isoleucyl-tRNA synthetase